MELIIYKHKNPYVRATAITKENIEDIANTMSSVWEYSETKDSICVIAPLGIYVLKIGDYLVKDDKNYVTYNKCDFHAMFTEDF